MKRVFRAALCVVALILSLNVGAMAQATNVERWQVLAKDARGAITRMAMDLSLTGRADCDQTQRLIPDGSKFVSGNLHFDTDASGVGTFQGLAQIITPDGRLAAQGLLRGTAGLFF